MNSFTYVEPAEVEEALALLGEYGDEAKLIAGGTGLINLMKQQLVQPAYLIGVRKLKALDRLENHHGLRLGALCTLHAIEGSPQVRAQAPMLAEACHYVATIRIRSMATIGGAVAHADPNQDTPPALIALDARVVLRSPSGEREVPVAAFFTGYYETVLAPDEMVTAVVVPPQPAGSGAAFVKFLPQTHDDYATVAVAARVTLVNGRIADARVALGAAGATPLLASAVADALRGQVPTAALLQEASALVTDLVDPTPDFRGSAEYKRAMAVVFTRRTVAQALARAQGGAGAV